MSAENHTPSDGRADQPDELVATIVANIQLAAEIMAEISASNATVSSSVTVGVQYSSIDVRISGPHEKPPDAEWLR